MKRAIAIVTLGSALALAPVGAHASSLDLRLGAIQPRTDSNLFRDDTELYQFDGHPVAKRDWRTITGGIEFNADLAPHVELGVSVDGFSRTLDTSYRDFVGDGEREIRQSLKLTVVPFGVSLKLVAGDRRSPVRPYVGFGGDLVYWRYEEDGEFIDFASPGLDILADAFQADGFKGGYHVAGGLRLRVSHDFSLTAEGRRLWARDRMGDDFAPREPGLENEIDLSSWSVTVGLNVRF